MLTIRHIRRDGTEVIHTAGNVFYWPDRGNPEDFRSAGLYLDPVDRPGSPMHCTSIEPTDIQGVAPHGIESALAIPISRSASTNDPVAHPEAFVMNANGATVARYPM